MALDEEPWLHRVHKESWSYEKSSCHVSSLCSNPALFSKLVYFGVCLFFFGGGRRGNKLSFLCPCIEGKKAGTKNNKIKAEIFYTVLVTKSSLLGLLTKGNYLKYLSCSPTYHGGNKTYLGYMNVYFKNWVYMAFNK